MYNHLKVTSDRSRLRVFNNLLTVVVVGLGLYIMASPLLPHFDLWWAKFQDNTGGVRYSGVLAVENEVETENLVEAPKDNRLVIPGIQLDEGVIVGQDVNLVNIGVWHRPKTSTPDQGSNTVLVGHRFSYNSPATFYHLDKMDHGDKFAIWWEGKEYVYEVFQTVVVAPSAIEIEGPSEEPMVTLYTCTPVWTAANRLVIKARLVNTDVLNEDDAIVPQELEPAKEDHETI